jgi:hypothetical protein
MIEAFIPSLAYPCTNALLQQITEQHCCVTLLLVKALCISVLKRLPIAVAMAST